MSGTDFWTRRRAAVAAEAEADHAAQEAAEAARSEADVEAKSDDEILADLGLKDPDTLEPGDDFAAYLKAAVPERLRRRALRRLWLSNPALANLDDLVDYGEDFTDSALVVEAIQTTYQVGKGLAKRVLEAETPEGGSEPDRAPEYAELVAETSIQPEHDTFADAAADAAAPADAPETTPTPRRMRFEFS